MLAHKWSRSTSSFVAKNNEVKVHRVQSARVAQFSVCFQDIQAESYRFGYESDNGPSCSANRSLGFDLEYVGVKAPQFSLPDWPALIPP
jgi:hypothetical protein